MSDAAGPRQFAIRRATAQDAEQVAATVRGGFQTVAEEIGIDIEPLHEAAEMVEAALASGGIVLIAETPEGEAAGTVRAALDEAGVVQVGRLAVLPSHRRAGLARALMVALEAAYPDAACFELFTGHDAHGPIALYRSLGYDFIEAPRETSFPIVWLRKCR